MNKKINIAIAGISAAAVVFGAVLPAFALGLGASAAVNASVTVGSNTVSAQAGIKAKLEARFTNIVTRADQEIARRITALNAISARVNTMVKLSSAEKGSLSANIQTELSSMAALQAKVSADAAANSTSSLLTDVKSITASYRIFALVIPQGAIEAASDRVLTTVDIMNNLGTKLSARIVVAQSAGNNVTATQATMSDFNAKVLDASAQSKAAANEVASLSSDNGNASAMASNIATLKDARAKIVASQKDLIAARADAQTVIKAIAGFKVSATASTTASSSVH